MKRAISGFIRDDAGFSCTKQKIPLAGLALEIDRSSDQSSRCSFNRSTVDGLEQESTLRISIL